MQNPVNNNDGGENTAVPINPFIKVLTWIFVLPCVLYWESTKGLFRKTYSQNDNFIPTVIGVLASLAAGIGIGYNLGWLGEAAWYQWSGYGVGTTVLTFFYGWPLLYLGVFRFAFRVSEKLWKRVNIEAREEHRGYNESDESWNSRVHNPAWFSKVLMTLGYITVGIIGLATVYYTAVGVQANQAGWGWLGGLLGIVASIVVFIIGCAIISGIGKLFSGFVAFLVCVGGIVCTWIYWGAISALVGAAWGGFTGSDWGSWGYFAGGLVGIFAAAFVTSALGFALRNAKLRLIAAATGFASVYALVPTTNSLLAGISLGGFSFAAPALPWVAYALELLAVIGFIFPLVHIFVTHALRKLADLADLLESAYGESSGFIDVFLQVASIAAALAVPFFAPAALTAYLGLTTLWTIIPATAALMYITYTLGGKLLNAVGNWPFGAAAAAYAAFKTFTFYTAAGYAFGTVGAGTAAAFAAAATFVVIFPIAYIALRAGLTAIGVLNIREGLIRAHERACSLIFDLVEEVMEAAQNAYGDKSPYSKLFAHIINLVVTGAVVYGSYLGGAWLGLATWLSFGIGGTLAVLSYLLIGKALLNFGSGPVGFVVAAGCAIIGGIHIHGAQPADWENGRYVLSIIGALVVGAVTFGGVFPVAYLIVRKVLSIVSPENWLLPALSSIHDSVYKRLANFFGNFRAQYRAVRESISKIVDSFKKQYESIAAQVRQILNNRK